jgi:hypothetical protein
MTGPPAIRRRRESHPASEAGLALLLALMSLLLLSALGLGLVLLTSMDLTVAANFRDGQEAFYAAEAGLERALDELLAQPDWDPVLSGEVRSTFADGDPTGLRTLVGGDTIDLAGVVNRANCGQHEGCTPVDMDRCTDERPWGPNNPRYQLFAWGPLSALHGPGPAASRFYVVVLVGDDGAELDGDPGRDSIDGAPGANILIVRAEAFGPRGAHSRVDATIARSGGARADPGYAGQSGGGEANRRRSELALPSGPLPGRTRIEGFDRP